MPQSGRMMPIAFGRHLAPLEGMTMNRRPHGERRATRATVCAASTIARATILTAFAAVCGSAMLFAQTVGANIGGGVTDDSGGRLPGVTVTVTNTSTGATQVFVTGPQGNYRAVALPPAHYQ